MKDLGTLLFQYCGSFHILYVGSQGRMSETRMQEPAAEPKGHGIGS